MAGTAFGTVGLLKAGNYSPGREAAIVEGYAPGNPIPADVRRRLRRKHFHRTAQDVAPVPLRAERLLCRRGPGRRYASSSRNRMP